MEIVEGDDEHLLQTSVLVTDLLDSRNGDDDMNGYMTGRSRWGRWGKHPKVDMNLTVADMMVQRQYFATVILYNTELFRRRFSISRDIFSKVYETVLSHVEHFSEREM